MYASNFPHKIYKYHNEVFLTQQSPLINILLNYIFRKNSLFCKKSFFTELLKKFEVHTILQGEVLLQQNL